MATRKENSLYPPDRAIQEEEPADLREEAQQRQGLLVTLTTAAEATEDGALAQNPFGRHGPEAVITSAESILLPFSGNDIHLRQKEHAALDGIQSQEEVATKPAKSSNIASGTLFYQKQSVQCSSSYPRLASLDSSYSPQVINYYAISESETGERDPEEQVIKRYNITYNAHINSTTSTELS